MTGIALPDRDRLPPGPHRALVEALHDLYEGAGLPGLRKIAAGIADSDFLDTISHEKVGSLLRGGACRAGSRSSAWYASSLPGTTRVLMLTSKPHVSFSSGWPLIAPGRIRSAALRAGQPAHCPSSALKRACRSCAAGARSLIACCMLSTQPRVARHVRRSCTERRGSASRPLRTGSPRRRVTRGRPAGSGGFAPPTRKCSLATWPVWLGTSGSGRLTGPAWAPARQPTSMRSRTGYGRRLRMRQRTGC